MVGYLCVQACLSGLQCLWVCWKKQRTILEGRYHHTVVWQRYCWKLTSATRPLQSAADHIKGTCPLVESGCMLPWESVNKPMNFNGAIMVTQPHKLFMNGINPICNSRLSYFNGPSREQTKWKTFVMLLVGYMGVDTRWKWGEGCGECKCTLLLSCRLQTSPWVAESSVMYAMKCISVYDFNKS